MRKPILILCTLVTLSCAVNGQQKPSPFAFRAEARADLANNFSGGIRTGGGCFGRVDLSMELSTEKAGWFQGGTFFAHALTIQGATPSSQNVGDIQPVSRIEASHRISLFEFWYRQNFGKVSLLFGQFVMIVFFGKIFC